MAPTAPLGLVLRIWGLNIVWDRSASRERRTVGARAHATRAGAASRKCDGWKRPRLRSLQRGKPTAARLNRFRVRVWRRDGVGEACVLL